MNLFLSVIALIISIMELDEKRIKLVVEFGFSAILSLVTFRWLYGDYTIWAFDDNLWTGKNITLFVREELFNCIVTLIITWFVMNRILRFIIIKFLYKAKPKKIKILPETSNKTLNKLILEKFNKSAKELNEWNGNKLKEVGGIYIEFSRYICYVIQLFLITIILQAPSTLGGYILYLGAFIFLIFMIWSLKTSFSYMKSK